MIEPVPVPVNELTSFDAAVNVALPPVRFNVNPPGAVNIPALFWVTPPVPAETAMLVADVIAPSNVTFPATLAPELLASIVTAVLVDVRLPPVATVIFPVVGADKSTDAALIALLILIASVPAVAVAVKLNAPDNVLPAVVVIAPLAVTSKLLPLVNAPNANAVVPLFNVMLLNEPVPVEPVALNAPTAFVPVRFALAVRLSP